MREHEQRVLAHALVRVRVRVRASVAVSLTLTLTLTLTRSASRSWAYTWLVHGSSRLGGRTATSANICIDDARICCKFFTIPTRGAPNFADFYAIIPLTPDAPRKVDAVLRAEKKKRR